MKREFIFLSALAVAALLLTSCDTEDEVVAPIGPYIGAWAYIESDSDAGSRIYARVDALAANESGYEIFASGELIVIHSEYIGGDFPTNIESEGTWSEAEDGDLVFTYFYRDWMRMLRVEILNVNGFEMECVETRLNW